MFPNRRQKHSRVASGVSHPDSAISFAEGIEQEYLGQTIDISLHQFLQDHWHVVEEGNEFLDNWHIEQMCRFAELACQKKIKRLLVTLPPRMGKSLVWSVFMHPWAWIAVSPTLRFLYTSYSNSLATRDAKRARNIIQSAYYENEYEPAYRLRPDQNRENHYVNTRGGERISVGLRGSITGEGANIIVVDDPHNIDERRSDADRNSAKQIFSGSITNRLNNPNDDVIIIIQQRIHSEDLAGKVIDEDDYVELRLPNEYDAANSVNIYQTADGEYFSSSAMKQTNDGVELVFEDPRSEEKELLFPERLDREQTDHRRSTTEGYHAIYQQDPASTTEVLFKVDKWRYWRTSSDLPYKWEYLIHSWDLSFKKTQTSGFVVGQVIGFFKGDYYLLHQVRGQMGYIESLASIRSLINDDRYSHYDELLIEDKANGSAAIEDLEEDDIPGIVPINPEHSKAVRAAKAATRQRSGHAYLPHPDVQPWVEDMTHRFKKFPDVDADDEIDAWSQGVNYLRPMEQSFDEDYQSYKR